MTRVQQRMSLSGARLAEQQRTISVTSGQQQRPELPEKASWEGRGVRPGTASEDGAGGTEVNLNSLRNPFIFAEFTSLQIH